MTQHIKVVISQVLFAHGNFKVNYYLNIYVFTLDTYYKQILWYNQATFKPAGINLIVTDRRKE